MALLGFSLLYFRSVPIRNNNLKDRDSLTHCLVALIRRIERKGGAVTSAKVHWQQTNSPKKSLSEAVKLTCTLNPRPSCRHSRVPVLPFFFYHVSLEKMFKNSLNAQMCLTAQALRYASAVPFLPLFRSLSLALSACDSDQLGLMTAGMWFSAQTPLEQLWAMFADRFSFLRLWNTIPALFRGWTVDLFFSVTVTWLSAAVICENVLWHITWFCSESTNHFIDENSICIHLNGKECKNKTKKI